MAFWLPVGAEMLIKSGRDMPREQKDDCAVVFPAADAEPVTLGATVPTSAGLLAIGKPHKYDIIAQSTSIYVNWRVQL